MRINSGGVMPPRLPETHGKTNEDALVQQLTSLVVEKIPALTGSIFKGSFKSVFGSVSNALQGLIIGAILGLGLGYIYNSVQPYPEPQESTTFIIGSARIYVYMIAVNALGGAALGFWLGLKTRIKKSVANDVVIADLLDSITDRIFSFPDGHRLARDRQNQLLAPIQGKINETKAALTKMVEDRLTAMPLMRSVASRFSGRILDLACLMPEMMFLNIGMTPDEGVYARATARERALSSLETIVERAVDSAFTSPIAVNAGVLAIFEALPFFLLISSFLTTRL